MRSTRTRFDAIQARAAAIVEYYERAARRHQHQPAELVLPEGKVEYCDCGETRHRDARGALVGFTAGARLVLALLLVLAAAACGPSSEIIPDPKPSTGSGHIEQDCGEPPYPGEDRCIVRAPHRGLLDALADLLVPSARAGLVGGNSGGHAAAPTGCPQRSIYGGGPDVGSSPPPVPALGADPPPVSAFEQLRLFADAAPADAVWTDPLLSLRLPRRERIPGLVAVAVCILALAALLRRRSRRGGAVVLLVLGCATASGCLGSAGAWAFFVGVGALALMAGAAALMLPHRSPPPPPPPPKPKREVRKLDWTLLLVALWAGAAQADERIGSMGERRPPPPTTRTEPHEPAAPKESTSPVTVGERPPAPKVGTADPPPAPTAADLIDSGEQALRDHSPALAHTLCVEAVRQARAEMAAASAAFVPPPPERPVDRAAAAARIQGRIDHYYAAYYCRGRAALALNLLGEAEESARWVIGPRGWVLLGDVLRAQDKCKEARAEYLRTVEDAESRVRLGVLPAVRPEEMGIMQAAAAGLVECGGDWPKVVPTPNEPQPSPWPKKRTGAEGGALFRLLDPCAGSPLPSLCGLMHEPLRLLAVALALVVLGLALVQGLYLRGRRGTR